MLTLVNIRREASHEHLPGEPLLVAVIVARAVRPGRGPRGTIKSCGGAVASVTSNHVLVVSQPWGVIFVSDIAIGLLILILILIL